MFLKSDFLTKSRKPMIDCYNKLKALEFLFKINALYYV